MNKFVLRQSLLLLLTATIWGVAFVAQSVGMDYVGPFTFNAVRCLIGGVVLLPCIAILNKFNRKNGVECMEDETGKEVKSSPQSQKTLVIGGIACGVLLCVASNLQQFGIMYTSVGKAGFITAMYIVIVPVLGIFLRKKRGCKSLVRCRNRGSRIVPLMYDGKRIFYSKGRSFINALCAGIFNAYFSDRLFFPESGRSENVVHTIFYLWNPVWCRNVFDGTSANV